VLFRSVIGAKACGWRAAWVQRDASSIFDPWEYSPDLTVHSLTGLAEALKADPARSES
jgi:2-haloacid dehalogenase